MFIYHAYNKVNNIIRKIISLCYENKNDFSMFLNNEQAIAQIIFSFLTFKDLQRLRSIICKHKKCENILQPKFLLRKRLEEFGIDNEKLSNSLIKFKAYMICFNNFIDEINKKDFKVKFVVSLINLQEFRKSLKLKGSHYYDNIIIYYYTYGFNNNNDVLFLSTSDYNYLKSKDFATKIHVFDGQHLYSKKIEFICETVKKHVIKNNEYVDFNLNFEPDDDLNLFI